MKELRRPTAGHSEVLFSFDPRRQAILLLGGDKTGSCNDWYERAVPLADDLSDGYLNARLELVAVFDDEDRRVAVHLGKDTAA